MVRGGRAGFVLAGLLAGAVSASAQATSQIPLQFNFTTPGARSMGLGGAFIGAADDATAAAANPAGLALISIREIAVEGRVGRTESPFLQGGRISGLPTGRGLDTRAEAVYGSDTNSHTSFGFASIVIPWRFGTIGLYTHQLAQMSNELEADGVFQRGTFAGVTDDSVRELPLSGKRTIAIRSYGIASGFKVGERFAAGIGVAVFTQDLRAEFARFNVRGDPFSPADRNSVTATATQKGRGSALAPNAGVLWMPASGIRIGVQLRRGASFRFSQTDVIPLNDQRFERAGRFRVPDVAGAGVELKLKGRDDQAPDPAYAMRVLADYRWVRYSQLKRDFVDIQALSSGRGDRLDVDDAHELHAGVEILLMRWRQRPLNRPVILRAGGWLDPDHAVRYTPSPANDVTDVLMTATLPGGRNELHFTAGGGLVISRRLELNAAVDVARRTTAVTVSTVVRF